MTIAVCTTWNEKGYGLYGRRFIEDFREKWPDEVVLYVYAEDHHVARPPVGSVISPSPVLLEKWKSEHESDPVKNGRAGSTYNFKYDAVRFANKVFAIHDCFDLLYGDLDFEYLVWLDGDVRTHRPVDVEWLAGLAPGSGEIATYLGRSSWPECGFMMFDLDHPKIDEFFEDWIDRYRSGAIFDYGEWHDSYVFKILVDDWKERGFEFRNIGDDRAPDGSHVFVNSVLGERLDHLKGSRKFVGESLRDDVVNSEIAKLPYWQNISTSDAIELKKRTRGLAEDFLHD